MKKAAAIFLQTVIVLFGLGVLAVLLIEPRYEGRNVNATFFETYFTDPFLAFVYVGSIPFFVGLFQAFMLLGLVRKNAVISSAAVRALRTIKRCGMVTAALVVASAIWAWLR